MGCKHCEEVRRRVKKWATAAQEAYEKLVAKKAPRTQDAEPPRLQDLGDIWTQERPDFMQDEEQDHDAQ